MIHKKIELPVQYQNKGLKTTTTNLTSQLIFWTITKNSQKVAKDPWS